MLGYLAGGATLNVATQCTKSGVVKKVYKGYIAIGAAPFWFMQHLKFAISSPIYWDSGNPGYNGYFANTARSQDTMPQQIQEIGNAVKRDLQGPFSEFFKAPMIKSDSCKSKVNRLGWYDWGQLDDWADWYAEHIYKWDDAGSCANHVYWDRGDQSYWVQSIMIRPNTQDGPMDYEGCDDGPW